MAFIRRKTTGGDGAVAGGGDVGSVDVASLPALMEYLTSATWPEGDARETSTLLVFVEEGRFKGVLNDREQARSLWASSPSLAGLLEALEGMLASGSAEWREQRGKRK